MLHQSNAYELAQIAKETGALLLKAAVSPAFTIHDEQTDITDNFRANSPE